MTVVKRKEITAENSDLPFTFCTAPEIHVGVELPMSIRGTRGGGVSLQGAGLQVGHVGHQVEVVTTGHTAQPLENL